MATGVLPLLCGRFTRLAQFFSSDRKAYEGEIRFGFSTDTYDAEGTPASPLVNVSLDLNELRVLALNFTGEIQQRPPDFSAKKINGVAAYKLARKDKPVELKSVPVKVHCFEIQSVCEDRARFVAEVSAGTYIRSLAHDLGQALGCGAHLTSLRRTRAGEFSILQAVPLDAIGPDTEGLHPRLVLPEMPCVTASVEQITYIRNGRPVNLPEYSNCALVKVFYSQTGLLAIAERVAGTLFRPKVVLYGSNEALP